MKSYNIKELAGLGKPIQIPGEFLLSEIAFVYTKTFTCIFSLLDANIKELYILRVCNLHVKIFILFLFDTIFTLRTQFSSIIEQILASLKCLLNYTR